MPTCPHCSDEYITGALFCDSCGRRLPLPASPPPRKVKPWPATPEDRQEPEQASVPPDQRTPEKPPHLRLQLLTGLIIDLGSRERTVIGRKDARQKPDVDLSPFGGVEHGVGRRHAVITLSDGRYYIEDLNSINETLLNSSRLFPGQHYPLSNGDQLQFGALVVKVLL